MPNLSCQTKPGKKAVVVQEDGAELVQQSMSDKIASMKKSAVDLDLDEDDEKNAGLIFDEAQFEMDSREYFVIEYLSGDEYRGELQG